MAHFGVYVAEGKPPNFANIPTPADYQTQIDEIRANPLLMKGTQKERMKLAEQEQALRIKMTEGKLAWKDYGLAFHKAPENGCIQPAYRR